MLEQLSQFVKRVLTSPAKDEAVRQEMLVRSRSFKLHFTSWLTQGGQNEILKNLYTSYTLNKLRISGDLPMHVFVNGSSRNVVLHYTESMGKVLFPYLQDYFRDRVMRIGYSVSLSDRQIISRAGHTEQIERHVLKPCIPSVSLTDKIEQLYGYITISVSTIDGRPLFLQITAETIQEKQYNSVFSFDELAEELFQ